MKTVAAIAPVLALAAALTVAAPAAPAFAADLTVAFPGAAPQGQIMVAVFNSQANYGGEGQPAQVAMLDAAAGQTSVTFDGLPDGDYAVRAFHDLNGDGPVFDAAFADGPRFLIDGANPGDDVISGGLGFNIQATERTAIELGYTGLYKDEYRDNRIYGRFSVKF